MNSPIPAPLAVPWLAWAAALLCSTTFVPSVEAAQKLLVAGGTDDSSSDSAYRKAIKDGVAEYDARRFEEARSLFRRAHELNPNARTFRGLGMTSFELRDYVSAVRNLSAALREDRKPLSAEQRKDVQDLLDRSRMFVDVYVLTVTPREARLLVDGRAPEYEADGTTLFGFGPHTIEAKAAKYATRTISINVKGGERKELAIALDPAPSPVARASAAAAAKTAQSPALDLGAQPAPATELTNRGPLAWLLIGGGMALLAGGSAVYWAVQSSELNSCRHPAPNQRCTDEAAIVSQRNVAMGATIGAGAAAATMVLIGILTWQSEPNASTPATSLSCAPGLLGLSCGGTFQ
jgi:hypothetical protein